MYAPCILIPIFNHKDAIPGTLRSLERFELPCLVINDGSDASTRDVLDELERSHPWIVVRHLPVNQGKGAAILEGLRIAQEKGYTHVLQIDADGQHDAADVPKFLEAGHDYPHSLILGKPIFDSSAPPARVHGRKITTALVWVETLSTDIADALCGFRLYPVEETLFAVQGRNMPLRMGFDVEILVRMHWQGVPVINIPTRVSYPVGGVSHFRYGRDNLQYIGLHTRLIFQSILRLPHLTLRSVHRKHKAHRHWSRVNERGSLLGLRLMFFLYRLVGKRVAILALYPIIFYFTLAAGPARRASLRYLRQIYSIPGGSEALGGKPGMFMVYRHFLEFGRSLIERISAWCGEMKEDDFNWENNQPFKDMVAAKQGAVLMSAHLGNVEVIRALSENMFSKMTINALMFTRHAARFNEILKRANPSAHLRIIPLESISPETIWLLQERIKEGEVVAILSERVTQGSPDKTVLVPFLGQPAPFPEGPWILAGMLECPVYLAFCLREKGSNHHIYFEKFADSLHFPRKERQIRLHAEIARYVQRLEYYCLKAPLQWFNFFDFWRKPL